MAEPSLGEADSDSDGSQEDFKCIVENIRRDLQDAYSPSPAPSLSHAFSPSPAPFLSHTYSPSPAPSLSHAYSPNRTYSPNPTFSPNPIESPNPAFPTKSTSLGGLNPSSFPVCGRSCAPQGEVNRKKLTLSETYPGENERLSPTETSCKKPSMRRQSQGGSDAKSAGSAGGGFRRVWINWECRTPFVFTRLTSQSSEVIDEGKSYLLFSCRFQKKK
ncbi:vegetative cell wall protein gp1-like [Aplysia californica]|uniref:Vegetative cell wall protein gp1-like n=1 Tax=Aplysia californica TaxID=6500 RepID=A0ABM1VU89_APLCA|nr:vegetative cell wall protein gp1-like [Aplysia californica]